MDNPWNERLSEALAQTRRAAFVGVGQELRGDDAAGILLIRLLQRLLPAEDAPPSADSPEPFPQNHTDAAARRTTPTPELLFFEAGPLPEASAGPLRRFRPEWVIFIDAADMGQAPGSVGWIEPEQCGGLSPGTHTFPISGFSGYLQSELGCRVAVLGIQPEQMEFDHPVSEAVARAIDRIAAALLAEWNAKNPSGHKPIC